MVQDDRLVRTLRASLERDPDIVFAYLFGSHATGEAGPRSDVDVAVGLRSGADRDPLRLMALVEDLGRRHLDLIVLNTAPPFIAYEALRGILLFSRDEEIRVLMEARIAREYLDREWAMRRDLDATLERIAEEGLG